MNKHITKMPFQLKTLFLVVILSIIGGCKKSDEVTDRDRAQWAEEDARNEAIEKEAHTQHKLWYEVRKDGQCRDIGSSARAEANTWQSYPPSIEEIQKSSDGHYSIKYRISSGPGGDRIYTTSYQWCENLQKKFSHALPR